MRCSGFNFEAWQEPKKQNQKQNSLTSTFILTVHFFLFLENAVYRYHFFLFFFSAPLLCAELAIHVTAKVPLC